MSFIIPLIILPLQLLKDYHETTSSPKSSKPELLAPDTIDA